MMMNGLKNATILMLVLFVSACNATVAMDVPVVEATGSSPVEQHKKLPPIAFEKAIASLKRGTPIANYPAPSNVTFSVNMCNNSYPNNAVMEWGSGTSLLGGWSGELSEIFNEAMQNAGYVVVGDPKTLFKVGEKRQAARYLIAAKVTDLRGNLCEEHDWWDGHPMGRYAAEWYQNVEWSVFSNFEQRVVGTFSTQGYARQDTATSGGVRSTLSKAFAAAAEDLAYNKEFYDLLVGETTQEVSVPKGFSNITIPNLKLRVRPLQSHIDQSVKSTVTVRSSGGHGSGFVISKDGYVVTNHHVVGGASEVSVIFSSGMEVMGQVLRSDAKRDVALIKVPLRNLAAFPLRTSPSLKALDVVYALGSPLLEYLKSTVTRGVVSAFRKDRRFKLPLIQSDVDISAGNSGGPLLDDKGNVVGISVSGYGGAITSAGLNMFIPIDSALEHLNITTAN